MLVNFDHLKVLLSSLSIGLPVRPKLRVICSADATNIHLFTLSLSRYNTQLNCFSKIFVPDIIVMYCIFYLLYYYILDSILKYYFLRYKILIYYFTYFNYSYLIHIRSRSFPKHTTSVNERAVYVCVCVYRTNANMLDHFHNYFQYF